MVDTSVFVAALKSADGASRQVLRLCLSGRFVPAMRQKLFLEFEEVMGREALFKRCPITEQERAVLFRGFLAVSKWVDIFFLWRPYLPDEGDNHVLELAVAVAATTIVTHNIRDFSGELRFPQVQVYTSAQFLKMMR